MENGDASVGSWFKVNGYGCCLDADNYLRLKMLGKDNTELL